MIMKLTIFALYFRSLCFLAEKVSAKILYMKNNHLALLCRKEIEEKRSIGTKTLRELTLHKSSKQNELIEGSGRR